MAKVEILLKDIFREAKIDPELKAYANNARFQIIENDLFLDFYLVEPDPAANGVQPVAELVQRIIMPINVAKGITAGLVNSILKFEKSMGTNIPETRGEHEGDLVNLWELINGN